MRLHISYGLLMHSYRSKHTTDALMLIHIYILTGLMIIMALGML